ncbi:MAG: hypothetical protein ABEJ40_07735 [Haloarculaceae archaeon]
MATDDADVDPEELQRQLSQIKEAVGIAEQYGSAVDLWLAIGVIVAVASAVSQYAYANDLPGVYYAVIWAGGVGGGIALYSYWRGDGNAFGVRSDRPNVNLLIAVVYAASFPVLLVASQYTRELGPREGDLLTLAVIVVMLGTGYVVAGHVLKAYRIRDRDRYPFYVGGVGMVALGVALPAFEILREWPYVAFGGGYLAYALVTYAYLTRTD